MTGNYDSQQQDNATIMARIMTSFAYLIPLSPCLIKTVFYWPLGLSAADQARLLALSDIHPSREIDSCASPTQHWRQARSFWPAGDRASEVAEGIEDNPWVIAGTLEGMHLSDLQTVWQRVRTRTDLKDIRINDLQQSISSIALAGIKDYP